MESEKENAEPEPVLEVGKWVLVEYDAELFPGTITQVCKTSWRYEHSMLIINPESYSVPFCSFSLTNFFCRLWVINMRWTL